MNIEKEIFMQNEYQHTYSKIMGMKSFYHGHFTASISYFFEIYNTTKSVRTVL